MNALTRPEDAPEPSLLTRQHIDRALHKRRRRSVPKACYPCRYRKVRCDHNHPCGNCVKQEQPKLCVYLDQNGQARHPLDRPAPNKSDKSTRDRVATLANLEQRMQIVAEEVIRRLGHFGAGLPVKQPQSTHDHHVEAKISLEDSATHFQHMRHTSEAANAGSHPKELGSPAHVGVESLASILVDTFKSTQPIENSPESFGGDMPRPSAHETMKLLYMTDAGSIYPFTSLWKPGASVEEICLALPDDQTFEQYAHMPNNWIRTPC